jgi:hypothetical protein
MRYGLTGMLLVIFFISCGDSNNNTTNGETNTAPVPGNEKERDLKLNRFDLLENIFQNNNWLLTNGNDSSYFYCSRLGKTYFKTYQYKIVKGDSVNTTITEMKLASDTIAWLLPQNLMPVYLNNISVTEVVWADKTNLNFYTFQKTDSNNIHIKYPDGSIKNMVKTITLSSFLVRSKYDYLHGTRLAFSVEK